MLGEILHSFDLELCEYALCNIRAHMAQPAFAAYARSQIDAPVLAYMHALDGETATKALLLSDQELIDLSVTFTGGRIEFDHPWEPAWPLHRRSIDCVSEIRDVLAAEYADEWARASGRFTKYLEQDRPHIGDGIQIVHEWIREARRLLRAMGALSLLPYPQGAFPTPTCPDPPQMPSTPPAASRQKPELDNTLTSAIMEVRDLMLTQRTVKDFYTTAEVATMLGKAEFTVREWCRNGRVHAQKQGSGRGKHQAWVISHEELQRLQREGLLPAGHPE